MWNLKKKKDINELISKTEFHIENELMVTKGERRVGWGRDKLGGWD